MSTKQGQLFETTFEATSHCRSPQIMSSSPASFTVQQVQKSFEPQNNSGRLFSEANNPPEPSVIFRHSLVVLSRRTGIDVDKKVVLLWLGNGDIRNIYEISTPSRNVTTTNRDRLATSPPKVVSKSWSCLLTRGLSHKRACCASWAMDHASATALELNF